MCELSRRNDRTPWFVAALVVLLAVASPPPGLAAGTGEVAPDASWAAARERLADALTSESIEQVDIVATTFDEAMTLIYRAVDTYLDGARASFPDAATAAEYGVRIIEGLDRHTVKPTVKTLVGGQHVVVITMDDARALGELLLATARVIRRIDENGTMPLSVRDTATRIFDSFLFDSENGVPMVVQYLEQVRALAAKPRGDLARYSR